MSRPARALWIEIISTAITSHAVASRPARALWIEILLESIYPLSQGVEAREGLVD